MLNHNEVIEKLTIKQKISLLTDIACLSGPELNQAGVPYVSVLSLEDILSDETEGLSLSRLANSWDIDLIEKLGCRAVADVDCPGAKLLLVPSAKPRLNAYQTALSEDPVLAGTLAAACANGVRRGGGGCCMDGFYLTDSDIEQLDVVPDMAAIGEMIVKPYIIAAGKKGFKGVMTANEPLKRGYQDINETISTLNDAVNLFNGAARLCLPRNGDETLAAILDGKIVIKGVATALESAYEKYHYLLKAIDDEVMTAEDLDEALEDSTAISDEMLDKAVDRILDFADAVTANLDLAVDPEKSVKREALSASCVLLKNDKALLPLKSGCRVAVIGQMATGSNFAESVCKQADVHVIGKADGYALDELGSGRDIEQAVDLAKQADKVLVFLGLTKEMGKAALERRELTLPANQMELLYALKDCKDKLIGIVDSDIALDMSFSHLLSAVMLAPIGGAASAGALADILSGRICPSGKLAGTLYQNTTEHFARLKRDKDAGKNKVGMFLGYRHYDSSDISVEFPFGHGLSYTSFAYSDLTVVNGEVSFTVKNTGSVMGAEIAQVYVGKPESARFRPRKELCGFVKTVLNPGEARVVRLDISHIAFYDPEADKWLREGGEYTVYVGSSVRDIRLVSSMNISGDAYTVSEAKSSDYLQAYSNILSDDYTVEPRAGKPKRRWRLKLAAAMSVLGAVILATVIFLILGGLNVIAYAGGGTLLAVAVALLIVDGLRTKKFKKKQEAEAKMGKEKYLEAAEEKEFHSIEELFVEEFDTVSDVAEAEVEQKVYVDDTSRYIDLNYTLRDAGTDLGRFMQERGIALPATGAMQILSAMAASRLVVADVGCVDRNHFYRSLAEYFGCPACVVPMRDEYVDTHLMFRTNESGAYEKTDLVKLLESAKEQKNTIHLAVFSGVKANTLFDLFMPYLKYFSNPLRENRILVKAPTATFVLPSNLWFIVELAEGDRADAAQSGVLKTVAAVKLGASECDAAEIKNETAGIGYYQFDHFIQQQKGCFVMSEELWKKIDSLEEYVASHAPYRIGNKQWLQMEKYLSMLTSEEEDIFAALDRALCVNLLPEIMSLLKGKIASGEKDLLEAMEQIFGDDKIPLCIKMLKNKGTSETN